MGYAVAYVGAFVVLGIADALWLSWAVPAIYKPAMGDILAPAVRLAPAAAFYLLYPIGIVVFATLPGLRAESAVIALGFGLLFGAMAYGTYDLTNYATLRNWTLSITLIDIVYGAIATALAAVGSYGLVRALSGWIGTVP
jgi:uncharacterized membrane protein